MELAKHIGELEVKPELIFSSPFYRCVQTSTPISKVLNIPINVDNGVGEWYKPSRSVIPEPASLELLNKFFDDLNQEWTSTLTASNKGETEAEILLRCGLFWKQFIAKIDAQYPEVKCILIVTHAATKIALGMSLLGFQNVRDTIDIDGEAFIRSGACSLDTYDYKDGWKLTSNGQTHFLEKGEEMSWNFSKFFFSGTAFQHLLTYS